MRGPGEFRRVVACNHVEEDGDEIVTRGAELTFPILPFEIKSFRVWLE